MFDRVLSMPRILNIPASSIYRDSEYNRVVNIPDIYASVLNMLLVMDMSGFWIYNGSKYASVRQGSEYT